MMGQQKSGPELFNYAVNLEKRVRSDHVLRRVEAAIDFGFVREEVAHCYGDNGNVSIDPMVILKMMILLFFDDVASERELMKIIAERATESKLEDTTTPESYQAVNDRLMSRSDPDAAAVSRGGGDSRPRYHHHRAVDDQKGVITAVETTPGSIPENKKLLELIEQHEKNTGSHVEVAVADHKYGTQENYVASTERRTTSHMGDASAKQNHVRSQGIFPESAFRYDPVKDVYRCPAGETLKPRRLHWAKRTMEYKAPQRVCAGCVLRAQCTRAKMGRSLKRHEKQAALDVVKAQAHSRAAQRDRRRRRHLMEASFADAANNHHFKRARWRRRWRQQIQDYLIASIQNLRILLKHYQPKRSAAAALRLAALESFYTHNNNFALIPRRV